MAAPRHGVSPIAVLGGQLGREWRAGPVHRLLLAAGPRPGGLAVRPRDMRPADAPAGERLMRGSFRFAGESLDAAPGGDPWDRPSPSRRFAAWLHGFSWAPDLLALGEPGARELLRLWLEWRRLFGGFNEFAWSGEALERRIFHLACAAASLLPLASEAESAAFLESLARQARRLVGDPGEPGRAAERLAAAGLVGASLVGAAGERLMRRALPGLERALAAAVLPDGVHASRSPERGLELLFDLVALDDALSLRGLPAPTEVSRGIDRLGAALRFFVLADGRLPSFHGGGPGRPARIAAALALESGRGAAANAAPYGDYQALRGKQIQVIADAGAPPPDVFAARGCAQAAALEVVCQGARLILASCAAAAAPGASSQDPATGSCLALGGAQVVGGWPREVKLQRHESGEGVWLEIAHDGWRGAYGLDHVRRLFLDLAADELRGEDRLSPALRPRGPSQAVCTVAFQLAPGVAAQVSADGKSALLKPAGVPAWRLRSDAARIRMEPGTVFEAGEPRAAHRVILSRPIQCADGGRVRWRLAREAH